MLLEELQDKLKIAETHIITIKAFYKNALIDERFNKSYAIINTESFWQNPEQVKILREHQHLKELHDEYHELIKSYEDSQELVVLFGHNEEELKPLVRDINDVCKKIINFKVSLLLRKEDDASNCFLTINAGAGGTESQDWAHMLLRMYVRFCERKDFKVDIIDYQSGEEAGIKNATLQVKGKNAYGLLKCEAGIHRLVRISPFDANKRRHTSFAGVTALPEIADEKVSINEDDLRIDTYRAGGAGGQHVNKTDSAVRITHIPTNIVVQCQNERSQLSNKQTAMKMLMAKLMEKQEQDKRNKESATEKKRIEWGSQIRSYVLHPYKMVKDHRTDTESPQPELVLDGDLMQFIESYLILCGTEEQS